MFLQRQNPLGTLFPVQNYISPYGDSRRYEAVKVNFPPISTGWYSIQNQVDEQLKISKRLCLAYGDAVQSWELPNKQMQASALNSVTSD
jgi:hypothetical protein